MKIAFIHPDAPGGEGTGATHSATQIVRLLESLGYAVITYCLSEPPGGTSDDDGRRFVDLHGFPYHTGMALNDRLAARAEEFDEVDVVHSYLPRSLPAMNLISRTTSASTVVTLNGYGAVCPKNDLRFLDRKPCRRNGPLRCSVCCVATSGGHDRHGPIYRSASRLANLGLVRRAKPERLAVDGLHALSGHLEQTYGEFGYPTERIRVIPNVLDEAFLVDHRSDFHEPFALLYVGALEVHKGVLMLPEFIDRLRRLTPRDFRLTIVGSGGARERMIADLESRGVRDRVTFLGQVPNSELPPVYASHDLFVYPGVMAEPFGRVFLESLAAGTPVVGTDVGGVAEIIGDAGVVTAPTAQALAETVRRELEEGVLEARASACRAEVSRYTPDRAGPAFRELYETVTSTS